MLKLARNALAHLDSIIDEENRITEWKYFKSLNTFQESEGFTLANKLSLKHVKFKTHKMNVKLAAQTLSSSVADAIEFLDFSTKLEDFQHSSGTFKFVRTIGRLLDILNSRNPLGNGFKQPLRPESRDIWDRRNLQIHRKLFVMSQNEHYQEGIAVNPSKKNLCHWICNFYQVHN